MNTQTPIDLNETLLPANADNAVVVRISEDSADFRKGDLLIVDRSKRPAAGDFVLLYEERENLIERYTASHVDASIRGTVTAFIRSV